MRAVTFVGFPLGSLVMLILFTVVPTSLGAPIKWPIVALVTLGRLAGMAVSFYADLRGPIQIRFDGAVLLLKSGLGVVERVPREQVLRVLLVDSQIIRGLRTALFGYQGESGRENWVRVTMENAERIGRWQKSENDSEADSHHELPTEADLSRKRRAFAFGSFGLALAFLALAIQAVAFPTGRAAGEVALTIVTVGLAVASILIALRVVRANRT